MLCLYNNCNCVCTDVEDVKFVINFDYPNNSEDYVHRIGRTGRSQRTGTAYTFFTSHNAKQAADLISVLREANQVINQKLLDLAEGYKVGRGNNGGQYSCFFISVKCTMCIQIKRGLLK